MFKTNAKREKVDRKTRIKKTGNNGKWKMENGNLCVGSKFIIKYAREADVRKPKNKRNSGLLRRRILLV